MRRNKSGILYYCLYHNKNIFVLKPLIALEEKYLVLLKRKVYDHFKEVVNDKVRLLQKKLEDLIDSTNSETKSSAGDKYETGRAMLQIEQDSVRRQLKETMEQKSAFEKIGPTACAARIATGSLVKTDKGYFYLSTALSKTQIDGITIIPVSPKSPLGSKLIGLKPTETLVVNGTKYTVETII